MDTKTTKTAPDPNAKSDDKTGAAAKTAETIRKVADAVTGERQSEKGPFIVAAFNDRETGERYAPGDALPDHILSDGDRMRSLMESGILSETKPAARTAQQRIEGGLMTVKHEDGRVDRGLAPEGFGKTQVEPAPGAPETDPAAPPQG